MNVTAKDIDLISYVVHLQAYSLLFGFNEYHMNVITKESHNESSGQYPLPFRFSERTYKYKESRALAKKMIINKQDY